MVGDYDYEQEKEVEVQASVWRGWEQFLDTKMHEQQQQPQMPRQAAPYAYQEHPYGHWQQQQQQQHRHQHHQHGQQQSSLVPHAAASSPHWQPHGQVQPLQPLTGQVRVEALDGSPTKRQRMR